MQDSASWEPQELERAHTLAARLRGRNSASRIFAVRAPGRVNLIGEHTDYSNLPVLPVAIDRSTIVVAAVANDSNIRAENVDRSYETRTFHLERKIPPFAAGDWANYLKAGMQGVIDRFADEHPSEKMRGANLIVDGRVPTAAGLSSSAALTVAAALALMAANGIEQAPLETAEMVARSEWYLGTRAGGMDQAASMLAERGHAMFIQFDPLTVRQVPLPGEAVLVVADSTEIAHKAGKVRDEYNRRVIECSIAARILGRALDLALIRVLGDVVKQLPNWSVANLIETLEAHAPARLTRGITEAAQLLNVSEAKLRIDLLGEGAEMIAVDENRPFEILRRARHVLSETKRVHAAVDALSSGLPQMGELIDQSHRSLRDDFEVSSNALDRMTEIARSNGALGARLTGAGLGGCIVALSTGASAPQVLEALETDYYLHLSDDLRRRALRTVVHAGPGAGVIEIG